MDTVSQYDTILKRCKDIYTNKIKDFGTSWRILRPSSLTDQLYIKALRIRTIEQTGIKKIDEDEDVEFMALVNYCIIGQIQLEVTEKHGTDWSVDKAVAYYDQYAQDTRSLMLNKNHDYGEAWRNLRQSSLTDLILTKLLRIKQIENNDGETLISEGIASQYKDIMNYAIFALIKIAESKEGNTFQVH